MEPDLLCAAILRLQRVAVARRCSVRWCRVFLRTLVGLFLYTYLGTLGQLGLNLARGKTHPRLVEYWTWGGAFVATALLFFLLTRVALKAIREVQNLARQGDRERIRGEHISNITD